MDDAGGVGLGERGGDLCGERQGHGQGHGAVGDAGGQCLALDQFHHDGRLAGEFLHPVDGADVGVVQGGGGPGLAAEAVARGSRSFVGGQGQEFESDGTAQLRILGAVDHAHASRSQPGLDTVMGDAVAGGGFGGGSEEPSHRRLQVGVLVAQQAFYFGAEIGIAGAGCVEQAGPFRRRRFQRCAENLFDSGPALRRHVPAPAVNCVFRPAFGHGPIELHGSGRDVQGLRRLFHGKAGEIAQLHHASLAWIQPGELDKGFVHCQDLFGGYAVRRRRQDLFGERHGNAAFGGAAFASGCCWCTIAGWSVGCCRAGTSKRKTARFGTRRGAR